MRVVLINKFGPPSDAPTARVIAQLAEALAAQGHEVEVIATRGTYRGSSRGAGRLVNEMLSLAGMFGRLLGSRKADRWIALSSPPGLLVPVALAAGLRRVKLSHWVMDLYPQTAVAFGVLPEGGLIHRFFRGAMEWALRRSDRVFVLDSDMQEKISVKAEVLPLWPLEALPAGELGLPQKCWLYSGNLGRGHEWRPLLEIQKTLEERRAAIRLVFQARGGELQRAKAHAAELKLTAVEWNDFAHPEEFFRTIGQAGILIATQRLEAKGCVWPSKLAVAARIERPLLWIGPKDGAVANWLKGRPGTGIFLPRETDEAAHWVMEWCGKELPKEQWRIWLENPPKTDAPFAARRLVE